jgi:hypothetical protein
MAVLEQLVAMYGEECALRLAGKDYVACKMLNANWLEVLTQLVATHGEEHALWIMGNRQHYNRCTCLKSPTTTHNPVPHHFPRKLMAAKLLNCGCFYGLLSPPGRYDRLVSVMKSPSIAYLNGCIAL